MTPVDQVETALGKTFGLGVRVFGTRSRSREVSWPRQIGMMALVDQYGLSITEAARAVGKHHGTVHHALKAVRNSVEIDHRAKMQVRSFLLNLTKIRQ